MPSGPLPRKPRLRSLFFGVGLVEGGGESFGRLFAFLLLDLGRRLELGRESFLFLFFPDEEVVEGLLLPGRHGPLRFDEAARFRLDP